MAARRFGGPCLGTESVGRRTCASGRRWLSRTGSSALAGSFARRRGTATTPGIVAARNCRRFGDIDSMKIALFRCGKSETIEVADGAEVNTAVGDGRGGVRIFLKLGARKQLPLRLGADDA